VLVAIKLTRPGPGYGKMLIFFTGYNFLIPLTIGAITLIISPLVAIEQDQAEELK
jgi:superfamily II DNA helicase RecQ